MEHLLLALVYRAISLKSGYGQCRIFLHKEQGVHMLVWIFLSFLPGNAHVHIMSSKSIVNSITFFGQNPKKSSGKRVPSLCGKPGIKIMA